MNEAGCEAKSASNELQIAAQMRYLDNSVEVLTEMVLQLGKRLEPIRAANAPKENLGPDKKAPHGDLCTLADLLLSIRIRVIEAKERLCEICEEIQI